jgi:hypothetical protein
MNRTTAGCTQRRPLDSERLAAVFNSDGLPSDPLAAARRLLDRAVDHGLASMKPGDLATAAIAAGVIALVEAVRDSK